MPEEVGDVVVAFIAGSKASGITDQDWSVDGGYDISLGCFCFSFFKTANNHSEVWFSPFDRDDDELVS